MHDFRPEVGGGLRVSLTYDSPDAVGKTSQHTDTYHGRFVSLDPERKVEQVLEFETSDLALQGKMRLVSRSSMRRGEQTCSCCTTGWRMALAKLAALVETDP